MVATVGYVNRSALTSQMLGQMRVQLDDLQRQLATGKRSETYSGLGLGREIDIQARARSSRVDAYFGAIDTVELRVTLMNTALERLRNIGVDMRSQTRFPLDYELVDDGQTTAQLNSKLWLDEALSLLNERAGDRYLFSGRSTDVRPAETAKNILDGDGTRAGLRQVMNERLAADQGPGATKRGRLLAPVAALSVVTLEEDGTHPFGFKLATATTDFGATITPDAGPPPSIDIDLGAVNPPEGGLVRVTLTLPDGTTKEIELTATAENPPPAGSFLIGATVDNTATNLAAALDAEIQLAAKVELVASSAIQASEDFFAIDAANPPQRVDGPPFDTATAMIDGTAVNTVFWYLGEAATDDPRGTAIARVDETITVEYGARANEDGLRQTVQSLAVFAAMTFSDVDPDARARYHALAERAGNMLDRPEGIQSIAGIQTEIAGANLSAGAARERHGDTRATLQGMIDEIENVSPEQVGVMLLALNTRLQATLQTTALLSQMTLLDYV